ncbi:MAG: hypothetical protein WCT03_26500 [Candidatus Obscuribacterales bacterium]
MAAKFQKNSETIMRLMSALSYLTGGVAGLMYAMFNGRSSKDDFFRYHFLQALITTMLFAFFSCCQSTLTSIFAGILGIFGSFGSGITGTLGTGMSILMLGFQLIYFLCVLGGVVQSARGKYLDIPGISKLVRMNLR